MTVSEDQKAAWKKKSSALKAELQGWYKEELATEQKMIPPASSGNSGSTVWNTGTGIIDSLRMVAILLYVEKHLNFQLPIEDMVKEGGHSNLEEALDHIMPQLEKAFYFGPPKKEEKKKKVEEKA